MSNHKEEKKHGDALEKAIHVADEHHIEGAHADAVPAPEDGSHSHSAAAHLGHPKDHTKPVTDLPHGLTPGEPGRSLRQVGRTGKQHRGR